MTLYSYICVYGLGIQFDVLQGELQQDSCCTDQVVAHGDQTGSEVVRVHHAVSLLHERNGIKFSNVLVQELKQKLSELLKVQNIKSPCRSG